MNDDRVNNTIDEAVLALLHQGIFEHHPVMGARSWKSFDWAAMRRLHDKGLISDPASKTKSVALTESGLGECEAEATFRRLFETDDQAKGRRRRNRGRIAARFSPIAPVAAALHGSWYRGVPSSRGL